MLIAAGLVDHLVDHPWFQVRIGGMTVTLMSSAIAAMVLAALILPLLVIPAARKAQRVPTGGRNVVEALVLFVRNMIARPALHERAYDYLPFLLTLFTFILSMNLIGLMPLPAITALLHLPKVGAATGVLSVAGGLAGVTFLTVVFSGFKRAAVKAREHHRWPMPVAIALSPVLWMKSLAPHIPGAVGAVLLVPLMLLELVGVIAKCGALMIRLFANMLAGHALFAAPMMFVAMGLSSYARDKAGHVFYVAPVCVLAGVLANILDLLVAFLQAYIFTYLSAMFIGLYAEPSH